MRRRRDMKYQLFALMFALMFALPALAGPGGHLCPPCDSEEIDWWVAIQCHRECESCQDECFEEFLPRFILCGGWWWCIMQTQAEYDACSERCEGRRQACCAEMAKPPTFEEWGEPWMIEIIKRWDHGNDT